MEQEIMPPQDKPIGPEAMPQGEQAAPKDKATETYRRLVLAAMKVIYTKEVSDGLVEIMRTGAEMPAEAVAQAASTVLGKLAEGVKGLDPKAVYAVTPPVVVFLMELAGAAKLFKPTPEIMQRAIQLIGEQVGGQQQEQAPEQAPQGLIGGAMQPQPAMQAGA